MGHEIATTALKPYDGSARLTPKSISAVVSGMVPTFILEIGLTEEREEMRERKLTDPGT